MCLCCLAPATLSVDRRVDAERELWSEFRRLQVPLDLPPAGNTSATTKRVGLAVKFENWGLFATYQSLVSAILHTVGNNMTLCLKVQRPGRGSMQPWAYYPSESFEAQHSCTSWRCYLGMAADVDL